MYIRHSKQQVSNKSCRNIQLSSVKKILINYILIFSHNKQCAAVESTHHKPSFLNTSGDTRVNEQPGLAAIHTVFVRIHNQIARELDLLRPSDTDEEIFQLTRKIVIAIIQNIHYNEWLPLIIGRRAMRQFSLTTGSRSEFLASVDPSISNAFSTAAFRFGHTLIPSTYTFGER